jgi:hypothetical protein
VNYTKVNPGDDLSIPATVWNALLDLLGDSRGTAGEKPRVLSRATPYAGDVVQVQNGTSDNIDPFRALCLSDLVVKPQISGEVNVNFLFNGTKPGPGARGKWGIVLDGLAPGQIGSAVVMGISIAWINLASVADLHVEADPASAYVLKSQGRGAPILWVDGGVGSATTSGEQWAIIRITGPDNAMFPVHVTKDGGSFSPTCSATYTVKDISDQDLADGSSSTATKKVPEARWADAAALVPFHAVADKSGGWAYYDSGGNLKLKSVDQEWPVPVSCADVASGSGSGGG